MLPRNKVLLALAAFVLIQPAVFNWQGQKAWAEEPAPSPEEVFQQRIMPIFHSENPSSCVQCHLSSVDLKEYIRPSHVETFLCLRGQGLIDIKHPEQSKILNLIRMGDDDPDAYARRIHQKNREAEYAAFKAWILACCSDPRLRDGQPQPELQPIGPAKSNEVIRFTRKNRVTDSFVRNVWSQRMRCFPCHTPNELDATNPAHAKPIERHADFVRQYGQRMNLFRESPEATLRHWISSSRIAHKDQLPLINLHQPAESLLVLKPTAKVPRKLADGEFEKPSAIIPVSHVGGLKMHVHDQSYRAMVGWISDYAKVVQGHYESPDQLPSDNLLPSEFVVRVKNLPEDWRPFNVVQLFLHAWDAETGDWQPKPAAFTQGLVTPKLLVNGSLFLCCIDGSATTQSEPMEAELKSGKYLVKIFYDSEGLLDSDPLAILGAEYLQGSVAVDADWKPGFKHAQWIDASRME